MSSGPLVVLLGAIAITGAAVFIYAFFATPVSFHKCAKEISAVLGIIGDPGLERAVYWGLMRSIAGSPVLALTLTVLLVAAYTMGDSAMDSVRTTLGSSLSTAPASKTK